jgi:hypothetical protein
MKKVAVELDHWSRAATLKRGAATPTNESGR